MSTTLVDSNVILDILTEDETWLEWSADALARSAEAGRLAINPIIYAEVAIRFSTIEKLDEVVAENYFAREPLPWEAAFLAGHAFLRHRGRGGTKVHPLPDFYIGAHAAVESLTLLTRDPRRYRTYLPRLSLVTP